MCISALFNNQISIYLPNILPVLQILGAVYMLYMAYKILVPSDKARKDTLSYSFTSGVLMTFINPKIVVYSLTILPAFVLPFYQNSKIIWFYVIIIVLLGSLSLFLYIPFGVLLQKGFKKYDRLISVLLSGFMVYSAVMVSGILN